ncbi:hypothetical protein ACIQD3_09410 [Peribacillus loiseleuriae]|uniref:hypothetical protein n=1 Tax=Peribacillus loiseleuriae TaxID=1679170 RepID=UPI0037F7BACD
MSKEDDGYVSEEFKKAVEKLVKDLEPKDKDRQLWQLIIDICEEDATTTEIF